MRTLRKANNIYKFKEPYDHKKCINSLKVGELTFKERVEKIEEFQRMFNLNLNIHLGKNKEADIAKE